MIKMTSTLLRLASRQATFLSTLSRPASIKSSCHHARSLHLCASRQQNVKESDTENNEPLRYSTSKAKGWTVGHSFGKGKSKENDPKKVAVICGVFLALLAWVWFRKETEIDRMLFNDLNEVLEGNYPAYKPPPNGPK